MQLYNQSSSRKELHSPDPQVPASQDDYFNAINSTLNEISGGNNGIQTDFDQSITEEDIETMNLVNLYYTYKPINDV